MSDFPKCPECESGFYVGHSIAKGWQWYCNRCGRHFDTPTSPNEAEKENAGLRMAIQADIQEFLTNSLTPDRGYETPISNTKEYLDARLRSLTSKLAEMEKERDDLEAECKAWNESTKPAHDMAADALKENEKLRQELEKIRGEG